MAAAVVATALLALLARHLHRRRAKLRHRFFDEAPISSTTIATRTPGVATGVRTAAGTAPADDGIVVLEDGVRNGHSLPDDHWHDISLAARQQDRL